MAQNDSGAIAPSRFSHSLGVMTRRSFLIATTSMVAGVGLLFVIYFFVAGLAPAADKGLKTLDVQLSDIEPGTYKEVTWLYRPIAIFRTSPELIEKLNRETNLTARQQAIPQPAPTVFVYSLVSTNRGCKVAYAPPGAEHLWKEWPGGFYDPCHFGAWDVAGRTLTRGSPSGGDALPDLQAPRYEWVSNETIRFHM